MPRSKNGGVDGEELSWLLTVEHGGGLGSRACPLILELPPKKHARRVYDTTQSTELTATGRMESLRTQAGNAGRRRRQRSMHGTGIAETTEATVVGS